MGLGDEEIPSDEGTEPNPDTCNLGTVFLIPDRRLGVCSDRLDGHASSLRSPGILVIPLLPVT